MKNWKKRAHQLKNLQAADRPQKAERGYQPPGSGARKLGQALFWGAAAFTFMLMVLLFAGNAGRADREAENNQVQEINLAESLAGVDFAKEFATEYFTWEATAEGFNERRAALAPMLATDLDPDAGLITRDIEWGSVPVEIHLLAVDTVNGNKSLITLEVVQELTKGEDERQLVTHNLAVPVGYANAYGIYELPSFTAVSKENRVKPTALDGEAVEAGTEQNILNFLSTFFQSYTTDTPDKLAYFLNDPNRTEGLENKLTFLEVQSPLIVKGKEPGEFLVDTGVLLQDPQTDTAYLTSYQLTVKQIEDRYVVTQLNKGVE